MVLASGVGLLCYVGVIAFAVVQDHENSEDFNI